MQYKPAAGGGSLVEAEPIEQHLKIEPPMGSAREGIVQQDLIGNLCTWWNSNGTIKVTSGDPL